MGESSRPSMGGQGHAHWVLRRPGGGSSRNLLHGGEKECAAHVGQTLIEGLRVLVRVDGSLGLGKMSPASNSVAMCIMVTPVFSSPLRMAQLMGADPR